MSRDGMSKDSTMHLTLKAGVKLAIIIRDSG